jgi:hypothetical protein
LDPEDAKGVRSGRVVWRESRKRVMPVFIHLVDVSPCEKWMHLREIDVLDECVVCDAIEVFEIIFV